MSETIVMHRNNPAQSRMLCGIIGGHYVSTDKGLGDITKRQGLYVACPDCLRAVRRRQTQNDALIESRTKP